MTDVHRSSAHPVYLELVGEDYEKNKAIISVLIRLKKIYALNELSFPVTLITNGKIIVIICL